jgi:hypothetical protein
MVQLHILNYEWTKLLFVDMGLVWVSQNFNTVDLVKKSWKKSKTSHMIIVVTLKMTSYKTMSQKKKWTKNENPRFYGQKKLFSHPKPPFSPWAVSATWLLHVGAP